MNDDGDISRCRCFGDVLLVVSVFEVIMTIPAVLELWFD
jgi:hypothetical protein